MMIHNDAPITFILMFVIFIFSSISLFKESFFIKMFLHPYSIVKRKQYYRLFTADLVHNDTMHLFLNEFMLFFSCASLEELLRAKSSWGSLEFLFIYFVSYFAGVTYTSIRHRNEFGFSSAGASGSIMGVLFSFIILKPNFIAFYLPVIGGVRNLYGGLIYILLMIWKQNKRKDEITNHGLHFFGALGGIAGTLILFPDKFFK